MHKLFSIQLRAASLLIIFSMNMVVGFACAVGLDMGFNTIHHHPDEATALHMEGSKHHHEKHEHKESEKSEKDNCCNGHVLKIVQEDKAVPQAAKLVNPVFFTAFDVVYYNSNSNCHSQSHTFNKYFVLGHHPPIPDIRIAIRSFQI